MPLVEMSPGPGVCPTRQTQIREVLERTLQGEGRYEPYDSVSPYLRFYPNPAASPQSVITLRYQFRS